LSSFAVGVAIAVAASSPAAADWAILIAKTKVIAKPVEFSFYRPVHEPLTLNGAF
jgi:hypothetical protein